jgi:hypothetical protein
MPVSAVDPPADSAPVGNASLTVANTAALLPLPLPGRGVLLERRKSRVVSDHGNSRQPEYGRNRRGG